MPAATGRELIERGHDVIVVPARTGTFGYGQGVMSDGTGRALRRF